MNETNNYKQSIREHKRFILSLIVKYYKNQHKEFCFISSNNSESRKK